MRTLLTIITIVLLLLGGSFTSYRYIQTTTHTTGIRLESVEQFVSLQNWEGAKKELSAVRESWDNNNTWWSILLDHQEIDRINLSMSRLEKLLNRQDVTLSLGEVSTLKVLFKNIYDNEKFVLENIL
ncbi:DUF4363 family protein [Desulfosporosinus sp.]|uniref:DUF4363 family protein n=1 Tax=Desulfosporosinus sp. TaxID=157907 RepID=UPI0025BA7501|nr:DUF4363 family protein [Desulfosporosinus sp.]MBC2723333.1 DUF4363 family protein [Desulfosporosinus sp.]MBC2726229.1 DUF4363 family protein [Desulfosporosinus sp.]